MDVVEIPDTPHVEHKLETEDGTKVVYNVSDYDIDTTHLILDLWEFRSGTIRVSPAIKTEDGWEKDPNNPLPTMALDTHIFGMAWAAYYNKYSNHESF